MSRTVCPTQQGWDELPVEQRARLLARQGQAYPSADLIRVVDPDMNDVTRDAETMGEVVMRGNNVMSGYFADPAATDRAFRGGWFHSGDLAVWHPDGNIELRDRSKDIIISDAAATTAEEIIAFCRERLAHYKCPDAIEFGPLPKTSTGKVQKFALREREWAERETRVGAT